MEVKRKGQLILRPHVRVHRHAHQPVLGIPGVDPAPVVGQVAVGIILKVFRRLRHIQVAGDAVARPDGGGSQPGRVAGVVGAHRAVEILDLAIRRHAVDGDIGVEQRRPDDVIGARHVALGDLVQAVDAVIGRAQVRAVGVAARPGREPVADGVELVLVLLAGHGRAVVPISRPIGHLPQKVILIYPVRAVHKRVLRPLVGGIVIVTVSGRQQAGAARHRGNLRQPVQIIVLFARRHPRRAALFERNLAHEGRIGKIVVGGRVVVAVIHGLQPGSVVVAVAGGGQRGAARKSRQRGAAHHRIVSVAHRKPVQGLPEYDSPSSSPARLYICEVTMLL